MGSLLYQLCIHMAFALWLSSAYAAVNLPLVSAPSAAGQTPAVVAAAPASAPTLVVGSEQDYPPFATGTTDASAGGFTVDLWKQVAAEAGLPYTLKVRPFHLLLQEFRQGKIDVLINLAQSDERRSFADFSVPHVVVHGALFVRKGESAIHSEADLAGKAILVLNADLAHDYALSKGWGNDLVLVDTAAQGMALLASGKHDAMLVSRLVGLQTLNSLGVTSVHALPAKVGFSQKFALATQPGQTELLSKLNEALAVTKANGVYNALYEKWFGLYEVREANLRDLLKYIGPIVGFFLLWVGYLLQRRRVEHARNHAALAESRDLLLKIIDTAPVRVFWKNQNLQYLGCNALFAQDAGVLQPQDLIGKDDFQMGWSEQAERYRADDLAVLVSGLAKLSYVEPQSTPRGDVIWLRTSKVPIKDQHDATIGLLGIYDDITEQKRIEERLRQLSMVVEQSPASVIITDLNARIQYVNPQFSVVTGYSAEEVLGCNPRLLQSDQAQAEVFAQLWRTLSAGEVWHGELINRRKNGQTYWQDCQIAPVRDAQGAVTHFVAVGTDVTERVRSNAKMDALLREQSAILQNQLIGVVTVRDKAIVWTNPAFAKMLGYTTLELAGMPVGTFFESEDAYAAFSEVAESALSSNGMYRTQIEHVGKDGTRIWVDVSGSRLDPLTGETLWGLIDITENKRLEEEVRAQALQDPMTRLANRRMLHNRLGQAIALSQRSARFGAVLALDLDNFKPLNDRHGHLVGDLLLIEVARRLTGCVRQVDTVARVGGDEFVIVLVDLAAEKAEALAQATAVAEKIRVALAQPYALVHEKDAQPATTVQHECSASLGLVLFANSDTPQDELLNQADAAMYQAKLAGRNAVRSYLANE
jgi:diguanylate cyclase (GGDEF)-like protein/PAS domain S-box-containing protein